MSKKPCHMITCILSALIILLLVLAGSCDTPEHEQATGKTTAVVHTDSNNSATDSNNQPESEILKPQPDALKPAQGLDGVLEIAERFRKLDRHEAVRMLAGYLEEETKVDYLDPETCRMEDVTHLPYRRLISVDSECTYLSMIIVNLDAENNYGVVFTDEYTKHVLGARQEDMYSGFCEYVSGLERPEFPDENFGVTIEENDVGFHDHGISMRATLDSQEYRMNIARYDQFILERRNYPLAEHGMDNEEGTEKFLRAYLPPGAEVFEFHQDKSRDALYFIYDNGWDELREMISEYARDAGLTASTGAGELESVGLAAFEDENSICRLGLIKNPSDDPQDWEFVLMYSENTDQYSQ